MVECSLLDDLPWPSSTFLLEVLPQREPLVLSDPPTVFEDYLTSQVLKQRRDESITCRESWAFVMSGMMQYATWLAYNRLDLLFDNSHMSVEYLLSCYQKGPSALCGCLSADLPTALQAISEHGEVTFNQFPFVASMTVSQDVYSRREDALYCQDKSHLGTCRPCDPHTDRYVVTTLAASADKGSFRYVVPCFPCQRAVGPLYFPTRPFHISGSSPEVLIACIKSELKRVGPLPASIGLDEESFAALQRGGSDLQVNHTDQGVYYRPRHMKEDLFHAVLIVGYVSASRGSYWICRTSHRKGSFGYTFVGVGKDNLVDGLFNVDMQEDPNVLINRALSFEKIMIALRKGEALTDLNKHDPGVFQKTSPASVLTTVSVGQTSPSQKTEKNPRRRVSKLWIWTLLFFLCFLIISYILIYKWHNPSE